MSYENGQPTFSINQNISQNKMTRQDKLKLILKVGLMMLFQFALPIALYYILRNIVRVREIWALLISCVPPLIIAIYGLISKKRVDVIGMIVIITFIASAIVSVSLTNGDPRIQSLRESVVMAAVGVVFIISLIPIKIGTFKMRPLVFYFFKDMTTGGSFGSSNDPLSERWDRYWASYQYYRRGFTMMTALTGLMLINELPSRVFIFFVFKFSPKQASLSATISHYALLINIAVLNPICAIWMKRQSDKIVADNDKRPE